MEMYGKGVGGMKMKKDEKVQEWKVVDTEGKPSK